ncbi:MAG: UTP--glucose-1-phosphate uridylyltransferase GalU [Nitrospirota bacterium]|nr:UTP--glucose-1-phosphate uridylyltransferase GalU [Nitrospirota bacterium]
MALKSTAFRPIRKAVLPAAGMGTRFLPATKASPKEMLPLVDKPLIQYVVEEAVACGITDIIIVTGRGKRAIEDHFDVSFELEMLLQDKGHDKAFEAVRAISDMANFAYIRQPQALGLGHAVGCARSLVGDEPFAVLLADDIIHHPTSALAQMLRVYEEFGTSVIGLQAVAPEEVVNYGVITPEKVRDGLHRVMDLVEKPKPADAPSNLSVIGRYILDPAIFNSLEQISRGAGGELQLTDAIRMMLQGRVVHGLELKGERYDAGSKLGFLKATVALAMDSPELGGEFRAFLHDLKL